VSREHAQDKGRRYLVEGRLTVERVDKDGVAALCRGDGSLYVLGWSLRDGWYCGCPALSASCAHLVALRLVTVRGAR
jgi:hypothetical protein